MDFSSDVSLAKDGWLYKKGSRMHRWSHRYFVLNGSKLAYKAKPDAEPDPRGTFDLVPGCIVTHVQEDAKGVIMGKKLYVFWVIWPEIKKSSKIEVEKELTKEADDSSGDEAAGPSVKSPVKTKSLKKIVETEMKTNKREQEMAAQQLKRHHMHDSNVATGMKVAAVAVGGVVIGALTAGIGVVPYITVVGLTAVAGGAGVLYTTRRPANSRLILASDSMEDALAWKVACEAQIARLEGARKYGALPPMTDPYVISDILGVSGHYTSRTPASWGVRGYVEGMRIMDHVDAPLGQRFRRAQLTINSTPLSVFLALMDASKGTCSWPKPDEGTIKIVQAIDDHADVLGLRVYPHKIPIIGPIGSGTRYLSQGKGPKVLETALSRFWRLDDDGSYLIAMNTATHSDFPITSKECLLNTMIILTVAPRKDHSSYDQDLKETLVSCTVQVQEPAGHVSERSRHSQQRAADELDVVMDSVLVQLLDLRCFLQTMKFQRDRESESELMAIGQSADSKELETAGNMNPRSGKRTPLPVPLPVTVQPGAPLKIAITDSNDIKGKRSKSPAPSTSSSPSKLSWMDKTNHTDLKKHLDSPFIVKPKSRYMSRTRGQRVNEQAAALRSQLAAKDFEVSQLEKLIGRQGKGGNPTESRELLSKLEVQLGELKQLQHKLHKLTGSSRDAERAATSNTTTFKKTRTFFSRSKSSVMKTGSGSGPVTPQADSMIASAIQSELTTNMISKNPLTPIPLHWEYSFSYSRGSRPPPIKYKKPLNNKEYCIALIKDMFSIYNDRQIKNSMKFIVFLAMYFCTLLFMHNHVFSMFR